MRRATAASNKLAVSRAKNALSVTFPERQHHHLARAADRLLAACDTQKYISCTNTSALRERNEKSRKEEKRKIYNIDIFIDKEKVFVSFFVYLFRPCIDTLRARHSASTTPSLVPFGQCVSFFSSVFALRRRSTLVQEEQLARSDSMAAAKVSNLRTRKVE